MSDFRLLVQFRTFRVQNLFLTKFINDSASFLPEKLKNHVILIKTRCFWAPRRQNMQNHDEITSKIQFWIRNVRNWTKSRNMDMSMSTKSSKWGRNPPEKHTLSFFEDRKLQVRAKPFRILFYCKSTCKKSIQIHWKSSEIQSEAPTIDYPQWYTWWVAVHPPIVVFCVFLVLDQRT